MGRRVRRQALPGCRALWIDGLAGPVRGISKSEHLNMVQASCVPSFTGDFSRRSFRRGHAHMHCRRLSRTWGPRSFTLWVGFLEDLGDGAGQDQP